MRIFLVALAVLIVALGVGAALLPMSMAAGMAASRFPDFRFQTASGSVWDGKLTQVSFGTQFIGDLDVKTELAALAGGKAAGTLGLKREGFAGQTKLSFGLGDGLMEMKDLTLDGNTSLIPGMPSALARADGRFKLDVKDLTFVDSVCQGATGEVWTDALTKVSVQGWVGPELRGPVTCAGGKLQVEAAGTAETGEDIRAALHIGQHLDMELTAVVQNVSPAGREALTRVGFSADGSQLVLRHQMGQR